VLSVPLFHCPSAANAPYGELKKSNYSGVAGAYRNNEWMDLRDRLFGDICINGIFFPESRVSIPKIEDGTSHTLAIGERTYIFCGWATGAVWIGAPSREIDNCASKNIRYPVNADHGQFGYATSDLDAPPGNTVWMLTNNLPFGSDHIGGAQFCYADTSVRMISEEIDFTVLEDLATIAGHEVIRSDP
jgi:hypothetical protein